MKKILTAAALIVSLLMFTGFTNKQYFDFTYKYNYAYISLPNGEIVEGKVEKWTDYSDGDQLQITIDGVTYLTDTTRAVLVAGK